ncbi:tetratricopeptide repeat protein [Streptomyces sp. JB150]|uniref:tetratricopeptide repeat protein n=1 Tax=Streptomyces sp. JB150 TaxID=2714844 RepID=UPI00140BE3F5|nr:tetratricopeptide repeat protein [Streptomyces sp. JB150]QIJ60647.1 serine protease [Streptomyces sp. JB150]
MDPQRLALVRTGAPRGSGSGYLVGPHLVLTALHVVRPDERWAGHIEVHVGHPRYGTDLVQRSARVCWPDPHKAAPPAHSVDVALLWLDEPVETSGGPVRWGRPGGVVPVPFEGAGFPAFAADAGSMTQCEYLRGELPVVSTSSSGWVLDCPVWPAPAGSGERPWAGASGSAIFCHGRLVGVAVEDNPTMGWRRLHAVPIHEALELTEFADLISRHGHPGTTSALEEVIAQNAVRSDGEEPVRPPTHNGRPYGFAPPAESTGPVTLPAAPAELVGRQGPLQQILAWLSPDPPQEAEFGLQTGTVVVSAVAGMGGVGKTALALHAAHQASQEGRFPGGVLFADLRGYSTDPEVGPPAVADRFLRALGVKDDDLPASAEEKLDAWRTVVKDLARRGRPLLVVLDNARTADQVHPLLPGSPHRALITSRQTMSALRGVRRITLEALEPEDSLDLLERALRAERDDDRIATQREDALRLAALCGHLPLALHITAALLRDVRTRSVAAQVEALEDVRTRLDALAYDDKDSEGRPLAVRVTFELSYQHLNADQARAFRLLASAPGPDISTDAAAALLAHPGAERLLHGLARAHLLHPDPERQDRWSMHDLVRVFADERGRVHADTDQRAAALARLLDHYVTLAAAADTHLETVAGLPVSDRFPDRATALDWLDAERPNLLAAAAADTGACTVLASVLTRFLDHRRHFEDAITLNTTAVRIHQEAGDRHREGLTLTNLGLALSEVRRFDEAVAAHRQALDIMNDCGDRQGKGQALTNLGLVLSQVRRFDEAIAAHTGAAGIFRDTGDRRGEAIALTNHGAVLDKLGRFDEAIDIHSAAARIFHDIGDRHNAGKARNNLALVLWEVGRVEEAVEALTAAGEIFHHTGDRHSEGSALTNLAYALRLVGRTEEAVSTYTTAVDILGSTGDRLSQGKALVNKGALLVELDRFEEAVSTYTTAVDILRDTGGPESADAVCRLGALLVRTGRLDEAVTVLSTAARNGAAAALCRQASSHAAAGLTRQAEVFLRAAADAGHLESKVNLGVLLAEAGCAQEAEDLFRAAADGGDANAVFNLGVLYEKTGRLKEARSYYLHAAAAGQRGALSRLWSLTASQRGQDTQRTVLPNRPATADTGGVDAGAMLESLYEELRLAGDDDRAQRIQPKAAAAHNERWLRHGGLQVDWLSRLDLERLGK